MSDGGEVRLTSVRSWAGRPEKVKNPAVMAGMLLDVRLYLVLQWNGLQGADGPYQESADGTDLPGGQNSKARERGFGHARGVVWIRPPQERRNWWREAVALPGLTER